jgi:hypothetical protein
VPADLGLHWLQLGAMSFCHQAKCLEKEKEQLIITKSQNRFEQLNYQE